MKYTKYLAIMLAIVSILTMTAWFLRNTLIQQLSGPILEEYDFEIVDVSLDALTGSNATIGYLELVHDKGTSVSIEGLTLPIGTSGAGGKLYTARKISVITATRTEGEPFEMAQLIDQFLSLPDDLSGSEIIIHEFRLSPYPTITDLRWDLTDAGQELQGNVQSIAMSVDVTRTAADTHDLVYSIASESAPATTHSIAGKLLQSDVGIAMNGSSSLELPAWEALLELAGIVPTAVDIDSGVAGLKYDVTIPYDAALLPSVTAALTPSSPLQMRYVNSPDTTTSILVETGSEINVAATFPIIEWSVQQEQASILINYDEWRDIPLFISDLHCRSGPTCSLKSTISMNAAILPFGNATTFEVSATQEVAFPADAVLVEVLPGATLWVRGLTASDVNVGGMKAELVSSATLELTDEGWRITAESMDTKIDSLYMSESLSLSAPVFLEKILVSEFDQLLSAESGIFIPSLQATMNDQLLALPGLKGDITRKGPDISFVLDTVGLRQDGTLNGRHNLDDSAGQIDIADLTVSLGVSRLSSRVSPWSSEWDLIAGTVAISGEARWDQESTLIGQSSIEVTDIAGFYGDTVFTGLTTSVMATYDNENEFSIERSSFTVDLVDIGVALEDVSAAYTLHPNSMAVDIENLRMSAFGGVVTADPFSFRTESDSNTVNLRAASMDLSDILSLKEFAAIEVSGRVGAELPITITDDGITIAAGTLTGEAPGGVIRYLSANTSDEASSTGIGLVTEALSHFKYETLTSEVNYNEDGDLIMQMQLKGRNPDLPGSRPVILNLGVENNVPQMLKSLQAARAVEEILEKKLERQ